MAPLNLKIPRVTQKNWTLENKGLYALAETIHDPASVIASNVSPVFRDENFQLLFQKSWYAITTHFACRRHKPISTSELLDISFRGSEHNVRGAFARLQQDQRITDSQEEDYDHLVQTLLKRGGDLDIRDFVTYEQATAITFLVVVNVLFPGNISIAEKFVQDIHHLLPTFYSLELTVLLNSIMGKTPATESLLHGCDAASDATQRSTAGPISSKARTTKRRRISDEPSK